MDKQIIFQGKTIYLQSSWYAKIIFPIVQLKNLFKTIYDFLLQLIWQELIEGKKVDNEIASLIAFVVFCLLSIGIYHIRDYSQIILIGSLVIWYLDGLISRYQYRHTNNQIDITIYSLDKQEILWILNLPEQPRKSKILVNKIKNIIISQKSIIGGAFQESLGTVWQIEINLFDNSRFVINEEKTIDQAFKSVQEIANKFDLSILFLDSQGNNQYASQYLDENELKLITLHEKPSIKCRKTQKKWHIYTRWNFGDSWQLLSQVFYQAGFFVFLIIMAKLMVELGQLLNNIIQAFRGVTDIIYFPAPSEWIIPNWTWKNTIELLFVIGFIIYKSWKISRVKHIYINQYYLTFLINNKTIDRLRIQDIQFMLLLNNSTPEIAILSPKRTIIINQFNPEISQSFLAYLEQGIQSFKTEK